MILGVDFSLTATGVCAITDSEAECVTIGSKPGAEWWTHPARVRSIVSGIMRWADLSDGPPAWVIESPSFGSKGQLDRLYSGWWMIVDSLLDFGWEPPLRVTPSQVKKFATGKGNASKHDVMLAVERRYPDARIADDNQADAVILAAIGAAAYGEPFNGTLTKIQEKIVADVATGKVRQ